jgi:hypothetical protein
MGTKLMNLDKDDIVVSVAKIVPNKCEKDECNVE